ncbi:hypothetical protein SVAN01_02760 [Stagonosporopsis vannaccii]|nr:hypothetical protein SVAN01_02760 [Stagonosporopsis vannaccii]
MAPLSSDEAQKLADSILKDLCDTNFACSFLHRIPGGSASFTFRGILQSPFVMPDGTTTPSVIVKKATEFAAINSDFALDSRRSKYENIMLKALSNSIFSTNTGLLSVCTPSTFFYATSSQIQIIEDLRPARDLAEIITARDDDFPQHDFVATSFALGAWLRAFHDWSNEPEQDRLKQEMSDNEASRELKWQITYDKIVGIAKGFPTIPEKNVNVLAEVRGRAVLEHTRRLAGNPANREEVSRGLIHGDFWTGNVLFTSMPKPQLHVIDFEFAHFGHRATDLGQMIGDLLEKSYMSDSHTSVRSHCEATITAFVKGYGNLSDEMAYRIIIHAGAHIINWCARHPGAEMRGRADELIQRAVAIVVKAWEEDQPWFDGHVLGCLFKRAD